MEGFDLDDSAYETYLDALIECIDPTIDLDMIDDKEAWLSEHADSLLDEDLFFDDTDIDVTVYGGD